MKPYIVKISIALILFLSYHQHLVSQTNCSTQSAKSFILKSNEAQPCITYSARDNIVLSDGFKYSSLNPPAYTSYDFYWPFSSDPGYGWAPFVKLTYLNITTTYTGGYVSDSPISYETFVYCFSGYAGLITNLTNAGYTASVTTDSNSQGVWLHIARNAIFTFENTSGAYNGDEWNYGNPPDVSFDGKTDVNLIFNTSYLQGTAIPDPATYTPDKKLAYGSIPGSASVSATGSGIYAIPVSCPPGIGGMTPQVSIAYNSQGGNGLVGWGFNISGISAITRMPQDVYHEGSAKGLGLDLGDRFAMDGNRLICTSGTYGNNNSEYRTENETFSIIKANRTANAYGPDWFEVTTKNGMKLKYGSATGKQVYTSGSKSTYVSWYLDYQEDVFGNYISYTYEQRGLAIYLKTITYGTNKNIAGGLTSSVEFYYETRTDPIPIVMGNKKGSVDFVLSKVLSKTTCNLFRQYDFEYSLDAFTRLVRVTESNGKGEKLNPTVFKWGNNNTIITPSLLTISGNDNNVQAKDKSWSSVDINGDGVSDLLNIYPVSYPNGDGSVYYKTRVDFFKSTPTSTGSATFPSYAWGTDIDPSFDMDMIKSKPDGIMNGDVSGDGKSDVVIPYYSWVYNTAYIQFYILYEDSYGGLGKILRGAKLRVAQEIPICALADLNNDGIEDLVYIEKAKLNNVNPGLVVFHAKDLQFLSQAELNLQIGSNNPQHLHLIDLNNDGLKDILVFTEQGYYLFYNKNGSFLNTPDITYTPSSGGLFTGQYTLNPGDFNGDGLNDFVLKKKGTGSGEWFLMLNNGSSGFTSRALTNITAYDDNDTGKDDCKDNCIVTDLNNDGKSDLIVFDATYHWEHDLFSSWKEFTDFRTFWYISNGNGFSLSKSNTSTNDNYSSLRYYVAGDFNGDSRPDLINYGHECYNSSDNTQKWRLYSAFNTNFEGGAIKSIKNGDENLAQFTYSSLSSKLNYSVDVNNKPSYPLLIAAFPLYVVNKIELSNGVSSVITNTYAYKDAIVHINKGFLGFKQVLSSNNITGESAESNYAFDLPVGTNHYYVPYLTSNSTKIGTSLIRKTDDITYNTYAYTGTGMFMYQSSATTTDYFSKNKIIGASIISSEGNLTSTSVKTYNLNNTLITEKTENHNGYADRISDGNPFANAPAEIVVQQKHYLDDAGNTFSNKTTFGYNNNGTLLTKTEFANKTKPLSTTYLYDGFGNTLSTAISDGVESRGSSTVYESSGRFPSKLTNGLNQSVDILCDIWGNSLVRKDANKLSTYNSYDSWSCLIEVKSPETNKQISAIKWVNGETEAPTGAKYYSESYTDNELLPGKTRIGAEYHDATGRLLRKIVYSKTGAIVYADFKYNTNGQLIEQTEPYSGTALLKTVFTYDSKNRISTEKLPTNITLTYNYYDADNNNNKQTKTLSTGESYTKIFDAAGYLKESTDPGGTIKYYYTSAGKLQRIESPGSITRMHYDEYSRQDTLYDPNAGTIAYAYNSFGELTKQVDARSKIITNAYDKLGRIITNTVNAITTNYTYDAPGGIGFVKSISSTGKAPMEYEYDELCHVKKEKRGSAAQQLTFEYGYDSRGRVNKLIYPAGLVITYNYNNYNDITAIYNQANTTAPIWKLDEVNSKGQITKVTYGNLKQMTLGYDYYNRLNAVNVPNILNYSYTFNSKNQLTNRTENGISENFTYDPVNRLKTVSKGMVQELNMEYTNAASPQNDRIVTKSDVGGYIYKSPASNHKLANIDLLKGLTMPQHDITYTAEGKIETLKETVAGGNDKLATFQYGVDDERFSMQYKEGNSVKYTRYYFEAYEKEINANGSLKRHINYINTPSGLGAIYEQTASTSKMHYVYTDYLGSLKCITDASGSVEQFLSYDAWGRRRNPATGAPFLLTASNLLFPRGYTGHEHLDEFNLINMNGRVYDPMLGVFLSPDNFVQAPDFTQNFNRYAYCVNNPMMYTDPSGEVFGIDDAIIILSMAYIGGMQANFSYCSGNLTNPFNPGNWNWNSSSTYLGIASGAYAGLSSAGITKSFLEVDGIISNGALQLGVQVGINGLGNIIDGDNFFEGWEGAALRGFVKGAIKGYQLSEKSGTNYWWGTPKKDWGYHRGQWSFTPKSDKPDKIIFQDVKNKGTGRINCMAKSFQDMYGNTEQHWDTYTNSGDELHTIQNVRSGGGQAMQYPGTHEIVTYDNISELNQNGGRGMITVQNYRGTTTGHAMALKKILYVPGKRFDAVVIDPYTGSRVLLKNFSQGTTLGTDLRFWFINL